MISINKQVSVIVPVYNVESRLEHCLQSILNQTYSNLEVLLINDGSKDNSGKICDRYAEKDTRIRVIHQENKGISFVRNLGIDQINNDYFVFVDSDDYVSKNYVNNLVNLMEITDSKLASCRYTRTLETTLEQNQVINESLYEVIGADEMLYRMLYHDGAEFSLCDKLYHKSLFEEIQFPDGELYEDIRVLPEVVKKAGKIALHSLVDYFNYLEDNSIQRSNFHQKKIVVVDNINKILQEAQEGGHPELVKAAIYRKCDILIELMFQISRPEDSAIKQQLWNEFKHLRKIVIHDNHPKAKKVRMASLISYLGLPVFEKMYRTYTKSK